MIQVLFKNIANNPDAITTIWNIFALKPATATQTKQSTVNISVLIMFGRAI